VTAVDPVVAVRYRNEMTVTVDVVASRNEAVGIVDVGGWPPTRAMGVDAVDAVDDVLMVMGVGVNPTEVTAGRVQSTWSRVNVVGNVGFIGVT
jgi:hypothetical protein